MSYKLFQVHVVVSGLGCLVVAHFFEILARLDLGASHLKRCRSNGLIFKAQIGLTSFWRGNRLGGLGFE
jgi:hypothetical protein